MAKSFNITRNDLKYLINEVCRKMAYLNEGIREGGKAGHMSHPFEVDEYTFGDYKELVRDLFGTGIEKYTEKLDGMNIYITVDTDGTPRFARNASDTKSAFGGMNMDDIQARWSLPGKDPTVLAAYKNAYLLFSDVVKKLQDPVGFFNGNGYRIYANCEVIDPIHPNVIPYPTLGKKLSFHGLVALSNDGTAKEVDLPDDVFDQKMDFLARLFPDVKSEYGQAQITPEVVIKIREDCEQAISEYISKIDQIEQNAGVSDDTTVIGYREKMLGNWLIKNGYGKLINSQFFNYFLKRWVYGEKSPTITQFKSSMKKSGDPNWEELFSMAKYFEDNELKTVMEEIMEPIELFFYSLGNEVLKGVEVFSNAGQEEQVLTSYVDQLRATQEMLNATGDIEYQNEMTKFLHKLSILGNEYNALEGVVFNYKGKTLKLTGSFAALNRAINIRLQLGKKYGNQGF